jgi:hypothetical protein
MAVFSFNFSAPSTSRAPAAKPLTRGVASTLPERRLALPSIATTGIQLQRGQDRAHPAAERRFELRRVNQPEQPPHFNSDSDSESESESESEFSPRAIQVSPGAGHTQKRPGHPKG